MRDTTLRYAKLAKILRSFHIEIHERRARGSEVYLKNPRTGACHVIKKHGQNPEITRLVIHYLRKKFSLTPADGVTDDDFYSRS